MLIPLKRCAGERYMVEMMRWLRLECRAVMVGVWVIDEPAFMVAQLVPLVLLTLMLMR